MSSPSDDRNTELREIFFESAQEILQAMNEEALRLEKHPGDIEALRGLRRSVHTLKGDAAACGYRELSQLAHEFEDVLAGENLRQSVATVETALTAADVFGEMLEAYRAGSEVPTAKALRQMIGKLAMPGVAGAVQPTAPSKTAKAKAAPKSETKSAAGKRSGGSQRKGTAKNKHTADLDRRSTPETESILEHAGDSRVGETNWTEDERSAITQAQHGAIPVYHLRFKIDPNCAMLEAALHIVRNILTKTGEALAFAPTDAGKLEVSRSIEAASASKIAPEELSRKFGVPGIVSGVQIETLPKLGAQAGKSTQETVLETAREGKIAAASEKRPIKTDKGRGKRQREDYGR